MSASFSVTACHGVMYSAEQLIKKVKNPLYGTYKYDPDTGDRVTEFLDIKVDYEGLSHQSGFDCCTTTDNRHIFIGRCSRSVYIGEADDEYVSLKMLNDNEMSNLTLFCRDVLKTPPSEGIKVWSVGRCSY